VKRILDLAQVFGFVEEAQFFEDYLLKIRKNKVSR
jgi:hypothetical protein